MANTRGQLEAAIARARVRPNVKNVFRSLSRRAGNTTGQVPNGNWKPPSIAILARDSALSERTVERALTDLIKHGWLKQDPAALPRIAGQLLAGRNCDCSGQPAEMCAGPGCRKLMTGHRPDARYCSPTCRLRAHRDNKRFKPQVTSVEPPDSPDCAVLEDHQAAEPPETDQANDNKHFTERQQAFHDPDNKRFKPQVTSVEPPDSPARGVREELSERGSNENTRQSALCRVCLTLMDPVLPAAGFTSHPCCDPGETTSVQFGSAALYTRSEDAALELLADVLGGEVIGVKPARAGDLTRSPA